MVLTSRSSGVSEDVSGARHRLSPTSECELSTLAVIFDWLRNVDPLQWYQCPGTGVEGLVVLENQCYKILAINQAEVALAPSEILGRVRKCPERHQEAVLVRGHFSIECGYNRITDTALSALNLDLDDGRLKP